MKAVWFVVVLLVVVLMGYVASLVSTVGNLVTGFIGMVLNMKITSIVPDPYDAYAATVGVLGVLIVVSSVAYMATRIRREEEVG